MRILLPHLDNLSIETVRCHEGAVVFEASVMASTAACVRCGTVSERVHSRYQRRLADAAIGGRVVMLRSVAGW